MHCINSYTLKVAGATLRLVFAFAAVLWVLLSFAFKPLGKFVGRLIKDAKDAMDEEDPSDEDTANKH